MTPTVTDLSSKLAAELDRPEPEPPDHYTAIAAMNWSSLKLMADSPLEFHYHRDVPRADTPHFALGRACHCLILEPDEFAGRFGVYDAAFDKRHKAFQEWLAENPGKTPLKQKAWDDAHYAAEAVRKHPEASAVLRGGRYEETITWTDEATGVACKARLDYVCPTGLRELKTTTDIREEAFSKDATNMLYYGQLAWYDNGARASRAIGADAELPLVIAIEKTAPYDVGVYEVPLGTMDLGRSLCSSLLRSYTQCLDADWWPGKMPGRGQLTLKPWAKEEA